VFTCMYVNVYMYDHVCTFVHVVSDEVHANAHTHYIHVYLHVQLSLSSQGDGDSTLTASEMKSVETPEVQSRQLQEVRERTDREKATQSTSQAGVAR